MEDVIRSRFDGGLLGTTHSAYKRLVKRFSASLNGQGLDSQALLKELSAFETNLLVSELARRRCAEKLKAGEGLEKELEEAREDLEVKSAELLVRASKRKKVEKVELLREQLNKLPSRSQLEQEAQQLENETAVLETDIRALQSESSTRKRKYGVLVECVDQWLDQATQDRKEVVGKAAKSAHSSGAKVG